MFQNTIVMEDGKQFKAAVAIVRDRDRWLLGLSTSPDKRSHTWCMPGGGIDSGEPWNKAAERECYEETGIRVDAIGGMFELKKYPKIAFVPCRVTRPNQPIKMNTEFQAMGWFKEVELYQIRLFENVKELIAKAKNWKK